MKGPKPDYEKDNKVKELREVNRLKFRDISKVIGEDIKNVHSRYRRAGGKLVGRLSTVS